MWRIENQPPNFTSCSDDVLVCLLVLVVGWLHWGVLRVTSSISILGLRFEGFVLREVYFEGLDHVWRALKTSILNTVYGFDFIVAGSPCQNLICQQRQPHQIGQVKSRLNFLSFFSDRFCGSRANYELATGQGNKDNEWTEEKTFWPTISWDQSHTLSMGASMVKYTIPLPYIGLSESDSKLYTNFEVCEGKNINIWKITLIYKAK